MGFRGDIRICGHWVWGLRFPKIRGPYFGGPKNKDFTWRPLIYGN